MRALIARGDLARGSWTLRLAEPLVGGAFVWKLRHRRGITEHIGGLVTGQRGLEVEHRPGMGVGIGFVVTNPADRAMPTAVSVLIALPNRIDIQLNLDSEIGATFLNRRARQNPSYDPPPRRTRR